MVRKCKIIVNADDCGKSQSINDHIEKCIQNRKISSTTIMANMDDFNGAIRLYNKYASIISFGVHLNLTEGTPLVYSQELLDKGLYIQTGDNIEFNVQEYRKHVATPTVQNALMKELECQIEKILDSGVKISHIDSHHFIHTRILTLFLTPQICKKYGITRLRRMANFRQRDLSYYLRQSWTAFMKLQYKEIKTTDYFTGYSDFVSSFKNVPMKNDCIVELMCHPGGIYTKEESLIEKVDIEKDFNANLINYNQL